MLKLNAGSYDLEMHDDPTFSVGSADNICSYDRVHAFASGRYVTSQHSIRVAEDGELVSSCILLAGGGASGIHEHSALVREESCIVAVGPFMASLQIPTLELKWVTETDSATCFGVYLSEQHQCLISHGELEIARVTFEGEIVWQASGADIFTNGFTVHDDFVQVLDFDDREYRFDIETGRAMPPR